uniref:Uncharacterized protein n=1 Tax=Megaselia scalaris TaxID=36166 RepID=T1GC66_MEGSC
MFPAIYMNSSPINRCYQKQVHYLKQQHVPCNSRSLYRVKFYDGKRSITFEGTKQPETCPVTAGVII